MKIISKCQAFERNKEKKTKRRRNMWNVISEQYPEIKSITDKNFLYWGGDNIWYGSFQRVYLFILKLWRMTYVYTKIYHIKLFSVKIITVGHFILPIISQNVPYWCGERLWSYLIRLLSRIILFYTKTITSYIHLYGTTQLSKRIINSLFLKLKITKI